MSIRDSMDPQRLAESLQRFNDKMRNEAAKMDMERITTSTTSSTSSPTSCGISSTAALIDCTSMPSASTSAVSYPPPPPRPSELRQSVPLPVHTYTITLSPPTSPASNAQRRAPIPTRVIPVHTTPLAPAILPLTTEPLRNVRGKPLLFLDDDYNLTYVDGVCQLYITS